MAMRGEMVGDCVVVDGIVIAFGCYCVRMGERESDALLLEDDAPGWLTYHAGVVMTEDRISDLAHEIRAALVADTPRHTAVEFLSGVELLDFVQLVLDKAILFVGYDFVEEHGYDYDDECWPDDDDDDDGDDDD